MAKRYSGEVVVTVVYEDRGDYKATVAIGRRNVWSDRIGAPASGFGRGVAYDSPKAYDSTARAALSFADYEDDEVGGSAAFDRDGTGWHIGRSAATKWPKQENPRKRKPRKSRASGVTVAARRVKRAAAKRGVKLSPAQIAAARRERVFSYMADPLEIRAQKLARMRAHSPELRAMKASRPDYEGVNFDPRRPDTSRTHERFMKAPKLPLRNPANKRAKPRKRSKR
jgi:hypothetical protein